MFLPTSVDIKPICWQKIYSETRYRSSSYITPDSDEHLSLTLWKFKTGFWIPCSNYFNAVLKFLCIVPCVETFAIANKPKTCCCEASISVTLHFFSSEHEDISLSLAEKAEFMANRCLGFIAQYIFIIVL